VCSGGTSPGMWMLSYRSGSNAITAFHSRNRVFAVSASAAPEVSARTLAVITFSRRSQYPIGHHVCCLYRPGDPGPFSLNALKVH
jgi:hypothetical protein